MHRQVAGAVRIPEKIAGGGVRILAGRHVAGLALLGTHQIRRAGWITETVAEDRIGEQALRPFRIGALDRKRMTGVGAVAELERLQRSRCQVRRADIVASRAQCALRVERRLQPRMRRRDVLIRVVVWPSSARLAAVGVRIEHAAVLIVDPRIAIADDLGLTIRPGFRQTMAEMAGDATVVAVVVRIVVAALDQAGRSAQRDIVVGLPEAPLDHAAVVPTGRGMTTQAEIADPGHVVIGDVERPEEHRIARRVGHHRTGPGGIRQIRHRGGWRGAADTVAGRAIAGRLQIVEKTGLRAVRREIRRAAVGAEIARNGKPVAAGRVCGVRRECARHQDEDQGAPDQAPTLLLQGRNHRSNRLIRACAAH